ncbi:DUF3857 domain-containing protein [Ulvibacterium marinum]|uniref:DUF3857 domain-containing protein n=2 Tax=Ulvibacterium marinum TaxID=2419782 RepID=A0A3B0C448_9FLAO|nr:DUF3857 domain-containing protein [Ulvibacterium marinum]
MFMLPGPSSFTEAKYFLFSHVIRIMNSMKFPLLVLFFLTVCAGFAQATNYDESYPGEDVITLELEKGIQIRESRGKLIITQNVRKKNLFLSTNTLKFTEDEISYNTFNQITAISANTQNLENGKIKYYPVTNFLDKDVLLNNVFFNDQKEKKVIYSNVTKNSITDLSYRMRIKDPHFIPPFIFWSKTPIVEARVSVSFPNHVKVAFHELNLNTIDVNFKEESEDGITTYSWILNEVPEVDRYYDFSPLYYIPQVIIYVHSYKHRGETISILKNTKDLYQWYRSLISRINEDEQEELRSITNALVQNSNTQEEKIKKIYYFVQDRINYIAFEDGLNGFIPRDAIQIYRNKYGDCKDMANILNEMLRYAGIDSYLTWIGTRAKPYSYEEVPTPFTDNHMITTVVTPNKDTVYLDATAKYLAYGYPSPFIQGKEALIGISPFTYSIKKVPEVAATNNGIRVSSVLHIQDEKLSGRHSAKLWGYEKLEIMHKIENKSEEDLDFIYQNLRIGTKQTSFKDINYENLERERDSLSISFDSETRGYIKRINNKLYIKPNLDRYLINSLVKDERRIYDKKIDYKYHKTFHTVIHIPDGYVLGSLPDDDNFESDDFEFNITYKKQHDQIIIRKEILVNTLKVTSEAIPNWNTFIKSLLRANKKNIILHPKT